MKKKNIIIFVALFVLILILVISLNSRHWDLETCNSECEHRGYDFGSCRWPSEMREDDVNIGSCVVPNSRHCGKEGLCDCYCEYETSIGGESIEEINQGSKSCEINSNCVVFGETGDCNCGCYNKDNLPSSTGGACFCAAPISCECVDNVCEGIFE